MSQDLRADSKEPVDPWRIGTTEVEAAEKFDFKDLFVLDLANNHQGDVDHGKRIIEMSAKLAQDHNIRVAVKFQFRDLDTFIYRSGNGSETSNRYVQRFLGTKLSWSDYEALHLEVKGSGLLSACTPFDEASAQKVEEMGFDILKIASASARDWPLLEKAAGTKLPIIASTGGLAIHDTDDLVSFLGNRGKDFALMHCVSLYPAPNNSLQLSTIKRFKRRYSSREIGWSTHESPDNFSAIVMAYSYGARIFERHIGIPYGDSALNRYSSSGTELDHWIKAWKEARDMAGSESVREVSEDERKEIDALRRGVFASEAINEGAELMSSSVYFAFPAETDQLSPGELRPGLQLQKPVKKHERIFRNELASTHNYEELSAELHPELSSASHDLKGMISESGVSLPRVFETEFSHHYGPEQFRRFGTTMITTVDRDYGRKLLFQLPGQENPEHYHPKKEETFIVLWGVLNVVLEGVLQTLHPGDSLLVTAGTKHSFSSSTGCVFEEVSSRIRSNDSVYSDSSINEVGNSRRKTRARIWGKNGMFEYFDAL